MKVKLNRAKCEIVRFFKETFRPRKKADYTEIFTRGGDSFGRAPYPWLWERVLIVLLSFFAAAVVVYSISRNAIEGASVVALAALAINISFLVLCFEIYPRRDISLLSLLFSAVCGGLVAIFIAVLGYFFYDVAEPYLSQLQTAVLEELAKFAATLVLILVFRRRDPFFCFLIGLSVGTGFSISEDMGYVSLRFPYENYVAVAVVRSVGAPFGHPMWAAATGFALGASRRPYADFKLYACLFGAIALHFLWDLPLSQTYSSLLIFACGVVALIATLFITVYCYRRARVGLLPERESPSPDFPPRNFAPPPEAAPEIAPDPFDFPPDFPPSPAARISRKSRLGTLANIFISATAIIVVALSLLSTFLCGSPRYAYRTASYKTVDEFVVQVQHGYEFYADFERVYDPADAEHDSVRVFQGSVLTSVTQAITDPASGHLYFYSYTRDKAEGVWGDLRLTGVRVLFDHGYYDSVIKRLPSGEIIGFFVVDDQINARTATFNADGTVIAEMFSRVLVIDDGAIITAAIAGFFFVVGGAACIALKIISKE